MNAETLKLKIFQQVDSLDQQKLEEIYGLIYNHINARIDSKDWDKLTKAEQVGLDEAIDSISQGASSSHEQIITELRKKYA
jgi:hypothetical protein